MCFMVGESWASSPAVAQSMRSNRGRDTKPELALRRILHARGLRYRVDFAPIGGVRIRPDVVFTSAKLVVFVDGCFWHSCPVHGTQPKQNSEYWLPKLTRNKERDSEADELLRSQGWCVLRFWEHEAPEAAARIVIEELCRLRAGGCAG